jgi:MFS family permease
MSTSNPAKPDDNPLRENENIKARTDPLLSRYLKFAAHGDQWKALHTKRLLRKVDFRLLPFLAMMYLLNFLDRSNLAQARLGTLEDDLDMRGDDFNIATSILFVVRPLNVYMRAVDGFSKGYLLMQVPSNLLLTRAKPSLFLGCAMTAWGAISAAQAASKSFGGLVACRVLLGVVEAPFFPGAIMLMSSWYTRNELAHRIAWWEAFNSQVFIC